MTANYHTPIPSSPNQEATASLFNSRFSDLDASLGSAIQVGQWSSAELAMARGAYTDLDARLDAIVSQGGNIATLVNGAANAGQPIVDVDSTTGFITGAYVVYTLVGGALEYNTCTVTSSSRLTLGTNIGTGGIGNDTIISMITPSEYAAANAIHHSGAITLDDAMGYAALGIYNALAYKMSTGKSAADNATALQEAIDAAATAGGGRVVIPPGTYALTTVILKSGVTLEGGGSGQDPIGGGIMLGTILNISGANYGIQIGGDAAEAMMNVRHLTIVGTASGKAGIRLGYHQASIGHYVGGCIIEDVYIIGFTSTSIAQDVSPGVDAEPPEPAATGGAGIFMPRGITCTLRNVRCQANYYGLYESSNHNSTTMVFDQCSFRENTKYGVRLSDFVHYTFRDCLFEANADSGLAVLPHTDTAGTCSGLTLNQCYFEANGDQGGSGTALYQMYIDGVTGSANSYLGRLRMDACTFQPGATGADNAVYLKNVRHAFLTYNSFGNNVGKTFTVDSSCEGILIISVDPASTSGWIGNTLAAKAVELLMSDATLTMNQGTLRLDASTTSAPLVIRQESDTNEQTFLQVLRNTSNNVLQLTSDANGDAELTMYADGGAGATYIKTGSTDEAVFPSTTKVAKLGVGNSATATGTVGTLVKKILVYDASGDPLGYIPVYDAIS